MLLFALFKAEAQTSVLNRADSLYVNGNYTKAIAQYKLYEKQQDVFGKMAKAYVAIGNYDEALKNYKRGVEANPEDALLKFEYARLLSKTKKYQEATSVFNDLIAVDDKNPNYHYELGLVLERLKDSTATHSFQTAYQLDETHQKAIFKLAKQALKKRKHDYVETLLDKGLSFYENNVELISLKAQNFYWLQYYRKAHIWFEKLIALGESSEFIHEKLSLCYGYIYDYENAIAQRKMVLKYNPNDANSMYLIGTYYYELNDFVNAEKFIKQALKIKDAPLDAEYSKLATVLNRQDKHDEAIANLKIAIKENPENIATHFRMLLTKDAYYADFDSRIKIFEDFQKKFPAKSFYSEYVKKRISELKEEKFLKAGLKDN